MNTRGAKKDSVIADLFEVRTAILEAASSMPAGKQGEVILGVWSVKDLLAHLAGWDLANIEGARDVLAGRLPGFYAHYDHDWRTYNALLVSRYKQADLGRLVAFVRNSLAQLVDFLKTIPADEFDRDKGLRFRRYRVTIERLIQAEIRDEHIHLAQLERFCG